MASPSTIPNPSTFSRDPLNHTEAPASTDPFTLSGDQLDYTVTSPATVTNPSTFSPEHSVADDHSVNTEADSGPGAVSEKSPPDDVEKSFTCTGGDVILGSTFKNLSEARDICQKFAKCALIQRSQKSGKFVRLCCYRAGYHFKRESNVPLEHQRNRKTQKCGCSFIIKLKFVPEAEHFEVYNMHSTHNHEIFEPTQLVQLPPNRFIPDEVKSRMLELNDYGFLKCSQILTLIEKEFDVPITWSRRDVQNLFQSKKQMKMEASEFITLLNGKMKDGWSISSQLNDETLRLERVFWISKRGLDSFAAFHDVLQVDATYKTNRFAVEKNLYSVSMIDSSRFGMPLVLFTTLDNYGVTNLVAGSLLSNERSESYVWLFKQFHV